MNSHHSILLKCAPYAVAFIFTVFELPSRLIAYRHRSSVHRPKIAFAYRWNKVAETLGYPFVVLFIALSHVHDMLGRLSSVAPGWWITGGVIYLGLVLMTLWLFAADLENELSLPAFKIGDRQLLGFDGLVVLTKMTGVLFPAALDIWVSASGSP